MGCFVSIPLGLGTEGGKESGKLMWMIFWILDFGLDLGGIWRGKSWVELQWEFDWFGLVWDGTEWIGLGLLWAGWDMISLNTLELIRRVRLFAWLPELIQRSALLLIQSKSI